MTLTTGRLTRWLSVSAVLGAALITADRTVAVPKPTEPSPTVAPPVIEVNLAERRLVMRAGEELLGSWEIAIGQPGHPTPSGDFRIRRIVWNPSWHPQDAGWTRDREPTPPGGPRNPMDRVKIFFMEPDYYVHGTHDESSIGRSASHGCIRMRNGDAIELARMIMDHAGETRPPNWFRRVMNRVTDMAEVRLTTPIMIRIS